MENLPEETPMEFRQNPEYWQILANDEKNQPSLQDLIDVLEQIKENEVKPNTKNKIYNKEPSNWRTKKKKICNKPGHDHEWKSCLDNPYKESQKKKAPIKECNVLEAECTERAPSPNIFLKEQY